MVILLFIADSFVSLHWIMIAQKCRNNDPYSYVAFTYTLYNHHCTSALSVQLIDSLLIDSGEVETSWHEVL